MYKLQIQNKEKLISNSGLEVFRNLRNDSTEIIEEAIKSVNPYFALKKIIKIEDNELTIKNVVLDINNINKILVVGGGKASVPMARALEDILKDRIDNGIVNTLHETKNKQDLRYIKVNGASHPIPDKSGMIGVKTMLEMVSDLNENDLVFAIISGGGSSLMPFPAENITLEEVQLVTERLLKAGATINELNSVRKHLSSIKGGQLAKSIFPARTIGLILSDVIGDPLDTIASGPTAPDDSFFEDALNVLKKYELLNQIPENVEKRLKMGVVGKLAETPKTGDKVFVKVDNFIVANNLLAANAAASKASELGYKSNVLSTYIEGEARQLGIFLGGISKSIIKNGNPLDPPAALIIGGETTVKVTGNGKGGRNQEVALSSIRMINGLNTLIATLGTDGIDGPTEAAGAIADGQSMTKAISMKLSPEEYLNNNDSYSFFEKMGDLIITGPTGTN
ncbi:DUF4147 domain-containing protein, partial [Candidatus Bathyarchaeota archaeon]|nr:DUF4147 domain-containing protein [Candidatus Bathyarchaeota archaeon]